MTPSDFDVVYRYFDAGNGGDTEALLACFTDDAIVVDDGETSRGIDEIRAWWTRTNAAFVFVVTPLTSGRDPDVADGMLVAARLDGDFPGSPVELKFRFGLRDNRIVTLDIAP
ncbi:MAG: hypothetical protein JWL73_3957 [Actinomycetia bacterium]|nr:hypothetical protein [Actinomycetes bacterium]